MSQKVTTDRGVSMKFPALIPALPFVLALLASTVSVPSAFAGDAAAVPASAAVTVTGAQIGTAADLTVVRHRERRGRSDGQPVPPVQPGPLGVGHRRSHARTGQRWTLGRRGHPVGVFVVQ